MQEQGVLQRLKTKWWKEMHGGGKCLVSSSLLKYLSTPIIISLQHILVILSD